MIEIMNYKKFDKGYLKAFFDIYDPETDEEVCGFSFFMKDGRSWVNMPSQEFTNEKGEKCYKVKHRKRDKNKQDVYQKRILEGLNSYILQMANPQQKERKEPPIYETQEELPF